MRIFNIATYKEIMEMLVFDAVNGVAGQWARRYMY